MELERYWAIIWKWLPLILIGTVIAGCISYVLSDRMEPSYRATATLVVTETTSPIPGYQYSQPAVTTHAELIETPSVMEGVSSELAQLGIYYSAGELVSKVSTSTKLQSPLVKIKARDNNPAVAQQIANTTIAVYIQQHRDRLRADAEASLSQIQSEINAASASINELELKKATTGLTSAEEEELATLKGDLEQLKNLRLLWNFQLAQALAAGGISLGESASLPTSPVSPKTTQDVLLACVLGLVVTTGAAFLKEYLDRSVKTAEDVSQLTGLSTLGVIARFKSNPGEKGGLIAEAHPRSSIAEAFRMLRTNLQFATLDRPAQTLLVTSAGPDEGKTSVLANLAVSLAQTGKKVIAVDTDLRRSHLHELFGISNEIGFTNLLLAQQPDVAGFLQPTKVEGLRVLTSGPRPHNPAELVSSPRISFLVGELRKEADIVLFDCAPVLVAADAPVLAAKLDATILVVEAGRTRPEALVETKEALSKGNVLILGAVLNRVNVTGRGGYYYHYRYPYHYDYYSDDGHKRRRRRRHPSASTEEAREETREETGVQQDSGRSGQE